VVWPPLMLLRLQASGAGVQVVPVWRDSVEPDAWRALAVAVLALERLTKPALLDAHSR
jgi:hypothetical protein